MKLLMNLGYKAFLNISTVGEGAYDVISESRLQSIAEYFYRSLNFLLIHRCYTWL